MTNHSKLYLPFWDPELYSWIEVAPCIWFCVDTDTYHVSDYTSRIDQQAYLTQEEANTALKTALKELQ